MRGLVHQGLGRLEGPRPLALTLVTLPSLIRRIPGNESPVLLELRIAGDRKLRIAQNLVDRSHIADELREMLPKDAWRT